MRWPIGADALGRLIRHDVVRFGGDGEVSRQRSIWLRCFQKSSQNWIPKRSTQKVAELLEYEAECLRRQGEKEERRKTQVCWQSDGGIAYVSLETGNVDSGSFP